MKPKFSIVCIAKDEAKTIPKMMESLKDFMARGGEVILVDTGSTDGTPDVARSLGCTVTEVGEKFITVIDKKTAEIINDYFVVDGEKEIVKEGNRLFDFASARNYATSLAANDMVCSLDCDEAYTRFDIDRLNALIDEGYGQFEYQFVFAHDPWGRPVIQFVQSKFFDRTKIQWTGIVHEVLSGEAKRTYVGPETIMLEHWQEQGKEHRGNYLVGLALDCFQHPDKDRQSHYLARELLWNGRPKSALKEFNFHITMGGWPAERAQSMIFIGDCYGMLGNDEEQVKWYGLAYNLDSARREALIKLALFYRRKNNYQATASYARAALEIPWTDYYANDKAMYEQVPHELLYWAYGWLGRIPDAQREIQIALKYQPHNSQYLRDTRYYFDYSKVTIIAPVLGRPEGTKRLLDSIDALDYPKDLVEVITIDGPGTVPEKVARGLAQSTGEYIVYASNDIEFTPDSLHNAVTLARQGYDLVAFNTGDILPDEGNICEHFIIRKSFVDQIGGEIFDTDFHHVGVDNLLWAKAKKYGKAARSDDAIIHHYHFSKGAVMDEVYQKGWGHVEEDRALLKKKLAEL